MPALGQVVADLESIFPTADVYRFDMKTFMELRNAQALYGVNGQDAGC